MMDSDDLAGQVDVLIRPSEVVTEDTIVSCNAASSKSKTEACAPAAIPAATESDNRVLLTIVNPQAKILRCSVNVINLYVV